MLKPQDIVILLKILSTATLSSYPEETLSQNRLATFLCISASEVHAGINRLRISKLLELVSKDNRMLFLPNKSACEECLIYGVKYFIPVQIEENTYGIPTSYAAPVFKNLISVGNDPIPVWPHIDGTQKGVSLDPLYPSVPKSLIQFPDPLFYDLLALVDAIRSGRARERNIAINLLKEKLNSD